LARGMLAGERIAAQHGRYAPGSLTLPGIRLLRVLMLRGRTASIAKSRIVLIWPGRCWAAALPPNTSRPAFSPGKRTPRALPGRRILNPIPLFGAFLGRPRWRRAVGWKKCLDTRVGSLTLPGTRFPSSDIDILMAKPAPEATPMRS